MFILQYYQQMVSDKSYPTAILMDGLVFMDAYVSGVDGECLDRVPKAKEGPTTNLHHQVLARCGTMVFSVLRGTQSS